MTLYEKALNTELHSRFVARSDDLNRPLTDKETRQEAQYLIETIPYSGTYEGADLRRIMKQLKSLVKSK